MAETPDASTQPDDTDEALKKKLLSRIAVAGVLIVALLGGLALIDAVTGPAKSPQQTAALPPEPEPAKPEAEQKPEDKPVEKAEEKPEEKLAEKPAEPAPVEEKKEEPKLAAVPAPAPAATSAMGAAPRTPRPLTAPATARPTLSRPAEPVAPSPRAVDPQREIARTSPQPSPAYRHAPASRPLTQATERTRQFLVQLGVFSNVANAEELRAKLELAGIPAHIEARVQVGPFATRQEADAAREKLRALGMDEGILTAVRR
jgi:DedD protein